MDWLMREKYHGVKTEDFWADCERLAAGEPLGYVIGFVPFLDCQIWLDSRPLIPRPETEYWTEQAIATIKHTPPRLNRGKPVQVLDLCAGSGAIGVAVARAVPDAAVTFVEIDPTHLPTIEKNLTENTSIYESISHQILQSDLFRAFTDKKNVCLCDEVRGLGEFLKESYEEYGDEKIRTHNEEIRTQTHIFDFILTNPPYIDKAADTVEESVTNHEPHLALFGGTHGMEIIERIIKEASPFLTPQGQLWIEHEPFQVDAIKESAASHGYTITHHPDQYGTVRYSVLVKNVPE